MQSQGFKVFDLHRILLGKMPWPFLFEVVLRTGVTYLLIMVAMRLMGKRVAAQLTVSELSIVVAIAAAEGRAVAGGGSRLAACCAGLEPSFSCSGCSPFGKLAIRRMG